MVETTVETRVGAIHGWYDFREPLSYPNCLKIEDTFQLRGITAKWM